jgi:hypothetical protein
VDSPSLLTWAVGVPNLLGGLVALFATDKLGKVLAVVPFSAQLEGSFEWRGQPSATERLQS